MKVLIIGASGLVGGNLYQEYKKKGHQVFGTYNKYKLENLIPLNVTNKDQVQKLIADLSPDIILHPAAYAYVDGCQQNPKVCRLININGVANVVDSIRDKKTQFVFFSTDYVFDGKSGPYKEEDIPNPINLYGKLKLEMEEYIKKQLNTFLIIRTANVFGYEVQGKNFVVNLIKKSKKGEEMKVVNDQFGNPTFAVQLAQAVYTLTSNSVNGLYHVAGSSVIDRYSFALEVCNVFNLNKNLIKSVTTDELGQVVPRPKKGGLVITKVEKVLPFKMYSSYQGLVEMKKNW